MRQPDTSIDEYLENPTFIWGDQLSDEAMASWLDDEADAYADMSLSDGQSRRDKQPPHALNVRLGFRHLQRPVHRLLAFGAADGSELQPIAKDLSHVTIVEPSDRFDAQLCDGIETEYAHPDPSGDIPVLDGQFDAATCLGALHHVPHASRTLDELYRGLKDGGTLLLREPVVSMGDWRQSRVGLTPHERGLPLNPLLNSVRRAGFEVRRQNWCYFSGLALLSRMTGMPYTNSKIGVLADQALCALSRSRYRYHAIRPRDKVRPTSVFLVLDKPHAT